MPIQSAKELVEAIADGIRADPTTLRKVMFCRWNSLNFRVEKPAEPLDVFSVIYLIFHDERNIRLYTLPAREPETKPLGIQWRIQPPQLFTLTKGSSDYTVEMMSLDTMADMVIEEWNAVADELNAADVELEAVIDYIEGLSAGGSMVNSTIILDGLRNEDHRGLDDSGSDSDSDDEPETEPVASAAPSVPTDAPAQETPPS